MSFDNRKQNVPKLFIDKIEIDKKVDEHKKNKVLDISAVVDYRKQKELRRNCEMFVTTKKVDQDGGGTPAGGSNIAPKIVDLMAA